MPKTPKSENRKTVASTVAPMAQALLAGMATRGAGHRPIKTRHVARLRKAALSCSKSSCLAICDRIVAQGVSHDEIVDRYIPAVARTLGEDWADDRITFASTSVGAAMLQWLLGALEYADLPSDLPPDGPGVLVLVPAGEHHTLGAVLLAQQLRRRGVWVRLSLQARAENLAVPFRQGQPDATMISASPWTSVHALRALVAAARKATTSGAPVLLGGTIADAALPDLTGRSGADHVATGVDEAVRLCSWDKPSGLSFV